MNNMRNRTQIDFHKAMGMEKLTREMNELEKTNMKNQMDIKALEDEGEFGLASEILEGCECLYEKWEFMKIARDELKEEGVKA